VRGEAEGGTRSGSGDLVGMECGTAAPSGSHRSAHLLSLAGGEVSMEAHLGGTTGIRGSGSWMSVKEKGRREKAIEKTCASFPFFEGLRRWFSRLS